MNTTEPQSGAAFTLIELLEANSFADY